MFGGLVTPDHSGFVIVQVDLLFRRHVLNKVAMDRGDFVGSALVNPLVLHLVVFAGNVVPPFVETRYLFQQFEFLQIQTLLFELEQTALLFQHQLTLGSSLLALV